MKTIEEKITEYLGRDLHVEDGEYTDKTIEDAYMAGYNEAMRWRDPKEELPENGEPVIVKHMTARGIKKYGIAKFIELGIGNPWTIEGSTGREVIGWGPIE